MSLLLTTDQGWLISHLNYLHDIYNNVDNNDQTLEMKFDYRFFAINSPFLRQNQVSKLNNKTSAENKRIRKKKSANISSIKLDEIQFIRYSLKKMISKAIEQNLFSHEVMNDYNKEAREVSSKFYETPYDFCQLHGSNQLERNLIAKINSVEFLFPKKCCFYADDIKNIPKKLTMTNQFNFILMDPPWYNKFVKRNKKQKYNMMNDEMLCTIPINKLLSSNGIIALWCTNADSHLKFILNVVFPQWKVKFIGKWFWVKVTQLGTPICEFNDKLGKQPYELLIFGSLIESCTKVPDKKLLVSVPSAIHSHKPPIIEVMEPYLPPEPNCLEIFARYLLPNWTSWGLEVLKLQQASFYNIDSND
ncbi:N(6)-adenine-specific methyltransferase METTL4 [Chelonus insularis]|uniref:N(6)-adenine-specific methyltransferase METTL4 n=1 Tax=Chelonus insularis TaxID=460826 RepID=UPI00158C7D21|nr:N(6)-adenine-specific methyltransferase METTL4 [Chelonus insularis]XP_034940929.1 N(6)-adenine-specific methyltransferase METTL4 [Chelonus insularis]XP_034940930.1 N(6)-adenine-specific methyltransferase METTL4 [Chelonus insularis]